MWASGSFAWARDNPLRVGEEVEQVTTIDTVEEKQGREGRGPMFFVWQRKELHNKRGLVLSEKRCHMFREPAKPDAPSPSVQKRSFIHHCLRCCSICSEEAKVGWVLFCLFAEAPKPAQESFDFSSTWNPSPVLLFRYSALTFNSHRIHYDRVYCRDVEKRPGLCYSLAKEKRIMS
jgi:3-methylfumaryl-CoA hydratase